MSRVDIIVGKLKPTSDKPSVRMERPDKMMSKDFVQKIDMSEHDMMMESCGEAIMQAIKQHDAKALAEALCDLICMHDDQKDSSESGESDEEEAY